MERSEPHHPPKPIRKLGRRFADHSNQLRSVELHGCGARACKDRGRETFFLESGPAVSAIAGTMKEKFKWVYGNLPQTDSRGRGRRGPAYPIILVSSPNVITTFPRACPSSRYRMASGASLKL